MKEVHTAGFRLMGKIRPGQANSFSEDRRQKRDSTYGRGPCGGGALGYVMRGLSFVDLRQFFGRRGSPGWRGVVAKVMQEAQPKTIRATAVPSEAGVRVIEPLPTGCEVPQTERGGGEDTAWVSFSMDDAISVEV